MAPRRDKDFYRDLKRCIKKAGNKKRRQYYKQTLVDNPQEAHFCDDFEFGEYSSEQFNGMDNDATRCKIKKGHAMREFQWEDKVYLFDATACYNGSNRILLPDGRVLLVGFWLESCPPIPRNMTEETYLPGMAPVDCTLAH
jgi:hypothetical protein